MNFWALGVGKSSKNWVIAIRKIGFEDFIAMKHVNEDRWPYLNLYPVPHFHRRLINRIQAVYSLGEEERSSNELLLFLWLVTSDL